MMILRYFKFELAQFIIDDAPKGHLPGSEVHSCDEDDIELVLKFP